MPPREKTASESDQTKKTKQPAKRAETLGKIVEEPESVPPGDTTAPTHGSDTEDSKVGEEDAMEQKTGRKKAGSQTHKKDEGKKSAHKKTGSVASSEGGSSRGARGSSGK